MCWPNFRDVQEDGAAAAATTANSLFKTSLFLI